MEGIRPQSAPSRRPPASQRPVTAPAPRSAVRISEENRGLESQKVEEKSDLGLLALSKAAPSVHFDPSQTVFSSEAQNQISLNLFPQPPSEPNAYVSPKKVSFKSLHLEKTAVDEYRQQQRTMALQCVTSIDGWEDAKNSLMSSIQHITSPDVCLTQQARKTVLNSVLNNFFAVLHIPQFKSENQNLALELQSKVPSYLLQIEKDIKERHGFECTVDLNDRESKQGILGTYGKQYLIESFIKGISLGRDDHESNLVVRKAALDEETRKLRTMRKELESFNSVIESQRSKLDDIGLQMKTKNRRIEELEQQIRRRDESHADQIGNLLKEIHVLKANSIKSTSLAQATSLGIQHALLATSKHCAQTVPVVTFAVDSVRPQVDAENTKSAQFDCSKAASVQEKRIRMLEDALCTSQSNSAADAQMHRNSMAAMINWASYTIKFEEELFAVAEKLVRMEPSASTQLCAVSGKQLMPSKSNEKLTSLLALTQELSKVSIEISKMNTQKLSKFYKVLEFASNLVTFIEEKDVVLTADLEAQKQELLKSEPISASNDMIMFGNVSGQKSVTSEDVELRRILGKDRSVFRNSLLDVLIELHKKHSKLKSDSPSVAKQTSKVAADCILETGRRDSHDSPKGEISKSKVKSNLLMQSPNLHAQLPAQKHQMTLGTEATDALSASVQSPEEASFAKVTQQRDDYLERLGVLSAEMTQLQLTLSDIQKQRSEVSNKTAHEFQQMSNIIVELTKEKDAVVESSKQESEGMKIKIVELTKEIDSFKDARAFVIAETQDSKKTEHLLKHVDETCESSRLKRNDCLISLLTTTKSDAMCQTLDWKLTAIETVDASDTAKLSHMSVDTNSSSRETEPPISHADQNASSVAVTHDSEKLDQASSNISGKRHEVAGTVGAILNSKNCNRQTNISSSRIASVYDEFDESVNENRYSAASVPKIDLSRAFLLSVGEAQANHFQQNGPHLPRFQKLGLKNKADTSFEFSALHRPRMSKSAESLLTSIAPNSEVSFNAIAKKRKPGVAVIEIPNTLYIPASDFRQLPYTSRPSTSNHPNLFIGSDIRPETARPAIRASFNKPQRPSTARVGEGVSSSKRGNLLMRFNHQNQLQTSPSSPAIHLEPHNCSTRTLDVENQNFHDSSEMETDSVIVKEYLKGFKAAQPS